MSHHPDGPVHVTLPMPPDYRYSYSGSALPFPSEESSFDPAQPGMTMTATGNTIDLPPNTLFPNHYYIGGRFSAPRALLTYRSGGKDVRELARIDGVPRVPGRSLTPATRILASTRPGPVTTQEMMLRAQGMPWSACLQVSRVPGDPSE